MQITMNGEARELNDGSTVTDLLATLNLPGTRVAVEVNKDIVRRAQHGDHVLDNGDVVEVVTFVGGG